MCFHCISKLYPRFIIPIEIIIIVLLLLLNVIVNNTYNIIKYLKILKIYHY
jgi:hypothetical protein